MSVTAHRLNSESPNPFNTSSRRELVSSAFECRIVDQCIIQSDCHYVEERAVFYLKMEAGVPL